MTLWNDTTKLWVAGFIQQLFGTSERTAYAWVGLRDRWRHIQAERRTMTRELWLQVCRQFDWTCLRCGVRNFRNQEWGKPKIEVDHVVSLFHWGLSVLSNLQTLCANCNRWKGVKDIDYRI
jgi:5-methylcytosine-specific restriction endonuclease McrA